MLAFVLTLLIIIGMNSNLNSITNLSIGFANVGNIDIIKQIQLLIVMWNWHRKSIDINKRMVNAMCQSDRNCIGLNKQRLATNKCAITIHDYIKCIYTEKNSVKIIDEMISGKYNNKCHIRNIINVSLFYFYCLFLHFLTACPIYVSICN